jgi:hypothetical protein
MYDGARVCGAFIFAEIYLGGVCVAVSAHLLFYHSAVVRIASWLGFDQDFALLSCRCQPWTIVLTGVTGISLSWLVIKSTIVTGMVTVLVTAWWYVFLYTYPVVSSKPLRCFLS